MRTQGQTQTLNGLRSKEYRLFILDENRNDMSLLALHPSHPDKIRRIGLNSMGAMTMDLTYQAVAEAATGSPFGRRASQGARKLPKHVTEQASLHAATLVKRK